MAPEWFNIAIDSFPRLLYAALFFTIPIALLSFAFSLIIGVFLAMILISCTRKIAFIIRFYICIFRGIPLLIQLFIIFYGLPNIGIVLNAFTAVVISLTLTFSSYIVEIARSSIMAIPKGQWEAAYDLGLTWNQTMRHIILPQAASTSIAPLSNEFISVLRSTSLASIVTLPEIFQVSQQIVSTTYYPLIIYLEVAIIYLAMTTLCNFIQVKLESIFMKNNTGALKKDISLQKEKMFLISIFNTK
ncbi:MAG: cysteine ABC transporter permease [Candidatus Liberibacter europaeus]|uniref:Cysteine ABC transporter permease n=1 Tax=Candidatus Liberibacter europaeus TaxID=744859 RepID=A0A2T4VXG9_9HYPH|nr:cysteine ABC transporter permease [Candidatus Liberibacter europaeus]PTL86458.1 MAG: cysteine ABC transporter permease [Candidatus Liberibacter europaeus]